MCVQDAVKKGASLYKADMRRANMINADLTNAVLIGADMTKADMRFADLTNADMTKADMRFADLTKAVLTGANLNFSSWPLWCGSCGVKLDKENNERFVYHCMINMDEEVLEEFLQNPVDFANRFAERKGISKIKGGEE